MVAIGLQQRASKCVQRERSTAPKALFILGNSPRSIATARCPGGPWRYRGTVAETEGPPPSGGGDNAFFLEPARVDEYVCDTRPKKAEVVFSEPAVRVRWGAYPGALAMMGEMVEGGAPARAMISRAWWAAADTPDTVGAVPICDQAGSEAVAGPRKPPPTTVRDIHDECTRCAQPPQVIALIGRTSRART